MSGWQDNVSSELRRIMAELERMSRVRVIVGVLGDEDSHMVKVARVHEYGATIRPKNAKNLAIPLTPQARQRSPSDYSDAWVLDTGEHRFLVQDMASARIEFLYLLLPSVTIPERSFIRAGYDLNKDKLKKIYDDAMLELVQGKISAETVAHRLGVAAVGFTQAHLPKTQPPKGRITLASDPEATQNLISSGRLHDSITYEVIGL